MQQIPLQAVPAQKLQAVLGGQNCQLNVYTRSSGLYVDLAINGAAISYSVLAQNLNPLVPTTYFGFAGNLLFVDTQGSSDPAYTGFGSRFLLIYITAAEYAIIV